MSDHTEWDLKKIREECLKLMGVTQTVIGRDNGVEFVKLEAPDGVNASGDPTTSLDDAIPLMEKYEMLLEFNCNAGWSAYCAYEGQSEDSSVSFFHGHLPGVAVCLCALHCSGRDLDDFKVKP